MLRTIPQFRRSAGLVGAVIAFALPVAAEIVCALGPNSSGYNAFQDQRPSPDAMQLAGQVNAAIEPICRPNCPQIALFRNATAPNAMLVASASGDAKIVYAPQFFTSIYESAGDGAVIAVIAHELGHAVSETAPVAWMKPAWNAELRADAWAGCALARVNLSARALGESLAQLAKYPLAQAAWPTRLEALRTGYSQCGGDATRFNSAGTTRR